MRVRERCTYIPTTWKSSRPPIAVIVKIKGEITVEIEGEIEGGVTVVIKIMIEGGVTVVITVVIKGEITVEITVEIKVVIEVEITMEKGCRAFDKIIAKESPIIASTGRAHGERRGSENREKREKKEGRTREEGGEVERERG